MSFFKRYSNKEDQPTQYKELSYKITWEPTKAISESEEVMYNLLKQAKKGKRGIIEKLRKYIRKYPQDPTYKNYLFVAYKVKGKDKEAKIVLQNTIANHPDYLFGKINLAGEYIEAEAYTKVPEILGEYMEISMLYPHRDAFHITEVMSFFKIAIRYFIGVEEWEQANKRLDIMKKIDPRDPSVEELTRLLEHSKIFVNMAKMREDMSQEIVVDSYPTVNYIPSKEIPELQHEILRVFYKYSIDKFNSELIDQVMALPRKTLIQDLELILKDSICRFDWFRETYEVFNDEEQEFSIHAFYFLSAINAKESLPTILDLFRQGEEFIEYWFSDQFDDFLTEPIYILGESQFELLKSFVLEPNLSYAVRLIMSRVVAQVAFHQPARKEEAVEWLREVLQYHLDHPSKKGIIDTRFIGWTVNLLSTLNAPEHSELIKALWEKGWIPRMYMGDLEVIIKKLNEPIKDYNKNPMPENIYEFYSLAYLDRRVKRVFSPEEEEEMNKISADLENNPMLQELRKMFSDDLLDEENEDRNRGIHFDEYDELENNLHSNNPIKPMFTKKIGRNQPCPCGSGKKYKKCCINK